ncbi:MAG: sulfatase [Planctomycetota bacterium]
MLRFPLFIVYSIVGIICFSASNGRADLDPKPNIVVILADDCTFRDLGCYGGQAKTPNIDRLATEGMKFSRCFQAAPMCSPTRHNLYTGIYPVKSGAYPNHTFVKNGTKSIAHYLKEKDYRVALSGKQHIGPKTSFPFEYSGKKNPDLDAIDQLFSECKESDTPFCLFACSNEPHGPWDKGDASQYPVDQIQLPPYIVDTLLVRQSWGKYLAEITYFDWQVGQILERLSKHELDDNTIVIVLSEQGNGFPFAKWTCYGAGLQSAMVVRWPNQVKPGSETDAMVEYVDMVPTLLDALGDDSMPDGLEGKSFLGVLRGETNQHKEFAYGLMTTRGVINGSDLYGIRTVRDQRFRLIWNLNHESKFTNACTSSIEFQSMIAAGQNNPQAQSLVDQYHYRPEFELFDCNADPLERKNLATSEDHQEVLQRLKSKLKQWMESQGDQGTATEADAILRQGRYRGLTREEAIKKYEDQRNGKQKKKKRLK